MNFATRADAKEWSRQAQRKGASNLRVYLCDCGKWHMTSGPKTNRPKGGKRKRKRHNDNKDN